MDEFFVSEQEKQERVFINSYKASIKTKDFGKFKNNYWGFLLGLDFIPCGNTLIHGNGRVDKNFAFCYSQGKKILSSEEFGKYSIVEKIIILINQPYKWRQGLTKESYLRLVKDWSSIYKAIEFYFVFEKPEVCADFNMADLKLMEINKWPDEIKLKAIKSLVENNKNNNLSDINKADELEKNEIFEEASIELKYLFIKKLLDNKIKNLGHQDNYLENDIQDVIDIARKNLDFRFLSVLSAEIYNNYGIDIDFGDEIIEFYNKNCGDAVSFNSLKNLSSYSKLNGNEKLRCLQLCDIEDSTLDEFDKILLEIDLNDFATKEYFLTMFFKKVAKFNPAVLTPAFIAQKSNWPIEIKTAAFQALPDFFRTFKNFKVIFFPEEIKYLAARNYDRKQLEQKIEDYVYALKPDFEFDKENNAKFNKLLEKIDRVDLARIDKFLDKIYKAMQDLTLEQLKIYINKIKNEIEKSEEKARALANYLLGDKKEKLPDYFRNDHYVEQFINGSRNTVKKFRFNRDFWLLIFGVLVTLAGVAIVFGLAITLAIVAPVSDAFFIVLSIASSILGALITTEGAKLLASLNIGDLKRGPFSMENKQKVFKQLEDISKEIKAKHPELNKSIKDFVNEVKNDKSLSIELGQRIKKESEEKKTSVNKKNVKDMSTQTDENKKLDNAIVEKNDNDIKDVDKNNSDDKKIQDNKVKLDDESKTKDESTQTDENKKLDNAIVEKNDNGVKDVDKNNSDGKKIQDNKVKFDNESKIKDESTQTDENKKLDSAVVEKNNADTKGIDKNNEDGKKIKDSEIKNDGDKNNKEEFVKEEVVVVKKTEYQIKKEEIKVLKTMEKNVVNKVNQDKDEKKVNEK